MQIIFTSTAFLVALICAALMGFAIQRGSICTVAALEELVVNRRATRLAAIGESAVWVGGCLLVSQLLGLNVPSVAGYSASGWTVAGGLLLGIGAFVNRGCAFGAVARIGSGEWSYLMTSVGFFAGSLAAVALPFSDALVVTDQVHVGRGLVFWLVIFALFALFRLTRAAQGIRDAKPSAHAWSPHLATTMIGLAFVSLFLAVGSWSYTTAIAELANGMSRDVIARLVLFLAVLGGALLGGQTSGNLSTGMPSVAALFRRFTGGALMGVGGALIPGSNDELILIGLPLLQPHAWIAFGVMCLTIFAAVKLQTLRR